MNYPNNSEFANVMKYISPNFNPGVRKWYGVEHEKHIVEDLDKPFYSYIPPKGFPMYPMLDPRNGNTGFEYRVDLSKETIMRFIVIAIVAYLVWSYYQPKK